MSTETMNGLALRPLRPPERKAVELRQRNATEAAIRLETGLSGFQVDAAVRRHAEWKKLRGTDNASSTPPADKGEPSPATSPVDGRLTIARLLEWAEASSAPKAQALAAKVRTHVDELKTLYVQHDAKLKAQAEVDRLTAELEAAKAALKQAGGAQPRAGRAAGAKPDEGRREQLAAIRTWAAAAGFEVSPLGRIPQGVVAAYNAAHETSRSEA